MGEDKKLSIQDNFKRRYAALLKIDDYLTKWEVSSKVKFTNRESGMLKRMHTSIERSLNILTDEYYKLFNTTQELDKYVKPKKEK